MYELWMLCFVAFPPLAYLGWLGLLGDTAKRAANRFFDLLGWVIALVGIAMMLTLLADLLRIWLAVWLSS